MFSEILRWVYIITVGFYLFGILAGLFCIFLDWLRKVPEPTEGDVKWAAERYREHFGSEALSVIGEHTLAASFAPDGRHRRFLKRVTTELMREEGIIDGEVTHRVLN
ncbi:MAG: hypothetical protein AAF423_00510 [Pseudomonadota bacterium]